MSTYTKARNEAEANGWPVPTAGGDMDTEPGWQEAWKRYWRAKAAYEKDPSGGRPVAPHRSGGGSV